MPISSALGSSALLPAGLGFRNIIINGGFDIWQRGTSVAIQSASSSAAYQADRWATYRAVAGSTQSQIASGLSGFQNAIRLQRDSGNTATNAIYLSQSFETSAISKVAGLPVVVSFYARAGANFSGSTLNVRLGVGTGTERDVIWSGGWTSYTEPLNQTITPTTSWQRFVLYVTVPAGTTQAGLFFAWTPTGTAGANDYIDIDGVQVEQNYQPTPFEQRPIGTELALCQRYYETSYDLGTAPTTVTEVGALYSGCSNANALDGGSVRFKVNKRAIPSIRTFGTSNGDWNKVTEFTENPRTFITPRAITHMFIGTTGYVINGNQQLASGRFYAFHYEASAEL
jgi:hypothetical protein